MSRPEFIYFAKCDDAIKVGVSCNVASRLATFATASPHPIELLGAMPGSRELEQRVHQLLAPHKVRSEWYRDCAPVRAVMRDVGCGLIEVDATVRTRRKALTAATIRAISSLACDVWPEKTTEVFASRIGADIRSAQRYLSGDRVMSGENLLALLQSDEGPKFFQIIRQASARAGDADEAIGDAKEA